jgi:hypothetical protein
MALTAQVSLSILAHEASLEGLSQTLRATPAAYSLLFSDGTAANQAQVAWSGARTLSGSSEVLNLSALPDERGGSPATVNLTAVKGLYVKNTGTAPLSLAGAPFPAGGVTVAPGGGLVQIDPTAAGMSASGVTVTGSSGGTYDIVLIGEGTVT